jgi:Uncharacterized protein conserved in bacteria (DUF2087)
MAVMSANSHAAALLTALASRARLRLLCTVAERAAAGQDCSLAAVGAALDVPVKALLKDVARLQECGLLTLRGDHAALRRMLVDFGQLTRDGGTNYRRAG